MCIGIFQNMGRRGIWVIDISGKYSRHTHSRLFGRYSVLSWSISSRFFFFPMQKLFACYSWPHIGHAIILCPPFLLLCNIITMPPPALFR